MTIIELRHIFDNQTHGDESRNPKLIGMALIPFREQRDAIGKLHRD
jgi:hypothetical protein